MEDSGKKKAYKRDAEQTEVTVIGMDDGQTSAQQAPLPARAKPTMTFNSFWLLAQRKYNLKPSLKDPVYKHMRARGFLATGDFHAGLKDFGVKE
jgi:hypothetical protein